MQAVTCLCLEVAWRVQVPDSVLLTPVDALALGTYRTVGHGWDDHYAAISAAVACAKRVYVAQWAPGHYTLASASRDDPAAAWRLRWWDSLPGGHAASATYASTSLRRLQILGEHEELPTCAYHGTRLQSDAWSCGLRVVRHLEVLRRHHRGEPPSPVATLRTVNTNGNDMLRRYNLIRLAVNNHRTCGRGRAWHLRGCPAHRRDLRKVPLAELGGP